MLLRMTGIEGLRRAYTVILNGVKNPRTVLAEVGCSAMGGFGFFGLRPQNDRERGLRMTGEGA